MIRDEALALVVSDSSLDRLEAARALQQSGAQADLPLLYARLEVEPDGYVRRALVRAIARLDPGFPAGRAAAPEEPPSAPAIVEEVWAEATDWVTGLLLHEIAPRVIDIGTAAASEIDDFEGCTTAKAISRLQVVMEAIGRIRRSAAPPALREFDLTDLVAECVESAALADDKRIKVARDDPVVTGGDPALIQVALVNGIRNAVDAIDALEDPDVGSVVLNWGMTDADAWVTVFDTGVGLPEGHHRVWDFGTSNKSRESHLGFGLPTANLAIQSLGGRISLHPRSGGGAALEVRWPVPREA